MVTALGFGLIMIGWCGWVGWNLMGRPPNSSSGLYKFPVVALFGWYAVALLTLLFSGLFGVRPWVFYGLLIAGLVGMFLDRYRWGPWLKESLTSLGDIFRAPVAYRWLWFALILFLYLLSRLPPFLIDVLYYHLGQPLHWLNEGRISITPDDPFSLVPFPQALHALWGLALHLDGYPGLMALLQVFMASWILADLVQQGKHRPWGILIFSSFISIPAVLEVVALHLNDAGVLWAGAGAVAMFEALNSKTANRRNGLKDWITAVGSSLVLVMKPLVPVGLVIANLGVHFTSALKEKKGSRVILAWFLAGLFVLGPWLTLTTVYTGDPLAAGRPFNVKPDLATTRWYDHLYRFTRSFAERNESMVKDLAERLTGFIYPRSPLDDIAGWPSFFLIFLVPPALLLPGGSSRWLFLLGLAGWYLTFRLQRYALFLYPAGVYVCIQFLRQKTRPRKVALFLLFCIILNTLFMMQRPTRKRYIRAALHAILPFSYFKVKPEELLPGTVPICLYASENLDPAKHRILFVGDYRYYPCRIPYLYVSPFFRHPLERIEKCAQPENCWNELIRREKITHIIMTPDNIAPSYELSPRIRRRLLMWIRVRGRIMARARGTLGPVYLIEILPDSVQDSIQEER